MKTFRIILWLSLASIAPAIFAQTPANRTALNTLVDSRLPSGTGSITAANLRLMFKDVIASDFNTINADAQPINANLTGFGGLANTAGWLHNDGAGNFVYSTPTGGVWGSITGTLSSQSDLNTALGLKAPLASPTFTGVATFPTPFTLGAVSVTATGTELNYVAGVTSPIQTQLSGKQASLGFTPVANTVTVNGHALSANVTVTNADLGAVPTTTTVNGHALSANVTVTASDVSLGSVTNDAQTKAAIVPNTAPAAGQILAGNAGGTAYAPVSISGDSTLSSAGAMVNTKINGTSFAALATGILKNTTATGTPSIAIAADFPTLNQNTSGSAATLTTSRNIGGSAFNGSADVTSFPSPGAIGGTTPAPGAFTTLSATGKVTTPLSGTGGAGLILPHGAAPTSPVNGDVWTTTLGLYAQINGGTVGPFGTGGGASGANPSATIGLTANNGVASTFMRSDATPILGVGIAPHWTGQHWFDLNPRITDNTAPTTATSALALGTNYTLNGLTANYSFTSLSGTSGKSRVHLVGCDGTHTFTWTTAAQRNGDPVATSTTITPSAGDHNFVFWYDTVTSAYYYSDDNVGINAVASGGTGLSSGTSGGILAFTASGTIASSGVLAANAIMVGGGAGVAPSTVTTGTGILTALGINTGSAGAPVLLNGAAGTPTSLTLTNATGLPVAGGGTGGTTAATARVALNVTTNAVSASAIDWSLSGSHSKTLGANTTFTFSNATDGETIIVALTNTASNWTVTWPTVSWSGGSAPTQTVGAHTDVYTFTKIGSTIYGSAVQNF